MVDFQLIPFPRRSIKTKTVASIMIIHNIVYYINIW